ncbi:MAG: sensor histidine kinase [Bacteroidales bacterium]
MVKKSSNKYGILILVALFLFVTIFLYLIDAAVPEREFVLSRYVRNIAISYSFMILIAWIDYWVIVRINNSFWLSKNLLARIIVEGSILSVIAALFVIVGNIPFRYESSVWEYLISTSYKEAVVASILLNLFTITIIEFFVQSERTRKLQDDNAKMQYQQLKSQINPHFLFNSLNVLVSLINRDADKATDYTKKLSDIYRYVLSYDLQETVLVREELEFIRNYTEILKIRFGNGLDVTYDLKEADLNKKIPPMSLQVLVENAVKHNALSPSDPLSIRIFSDAKDIIVSNNIIPRMRVASSLGIGLHNLNEKYKLISDQAVSVDKNDHEFTVRLPLL